MDENIELVDFKYEEISYRTSLTKKFAARTPYTPPDSRKVIAFIPGTILKVNVKEGHKVKKGDTVLFVIHNAGEVKHEFVLGTESALKEHNEFMKQHPDMEHDDDSMVTVLPGESADIIWQFTRSGTVHFACLQPGHYAAGMKGNVSVSGSGHKHTTKH